MTVVDSPRFEPVEIGGIPREVKSGEGISYKAVTGQLTGWGDQGEGIVEAIVSVTGTEDEVQDVIEPGAYTKTLAKRKPKCVLNHAWDQWAGKLLEVTELMPGDPRLTDEIRSSGGGGLYVKVLFNLATQLGRDTYENVKFFGDECAWSIGYQVPTGGATYDTKTGVRHIKTLNLFEVSPVLHGAHPMARTLSVKSLAESLMICRNGVCEPCAEAKHGHLGAPGYELLHPGRHSAHNIDVTPGAPGTPKLTFVAGGDKTPSPPVNDWLGWSPVPSVFAHRQTASHQEFDLEATSVIGGSNTEDNPYYWSVTNRNMSTIESIRPGELHPGDTIAPPDKDGMGDTSLYREVRNVRHQSRLSPDNHVEHYVRVETTAGDVVEFDPAEPIDRITPSEPIDEGPAPSMQDAKQRAALALSRILQRGRSKSLEARLLLARKSLEAKHGNAGDPGYSVLHPNSTVPDRAGKPTGVLAAGIARLKAEGKPASKPKASKPKAKKAPKLGSPENPIEGELVEGEDLVRQALESTEKPTKVRTVEEAAELLGQGKPVELDQPRMVSTLLDRLAMLVKDAEEKGRQAPTYDLCKVTVKGSNLFCVESKGIPRIQMPQLGGRPAEGSKGSKLEKNVKGEVDLTEQFKEHLEAKGIKVTNGTEKASYLKATQNELNGEKVAGMAAAMRSGVKMDGALFVSRDNYVVDGHHRWAAVVGNDLADNQEGDLDMNVNRIDADIITILAEANRFASEWGIPQAGVNAPSATNAGKPGAPAEGASAPAEGASAAARAGTVGAVGVSARSAPASRPRPAAPRPSPSTATRPSPTRPSPVGDTPELDTPEIDEDDAEELAIKVRPPMHRASDEERKGIKGVRKPIPPAWTDVWMADSPDSPLQVVGRDSKGRQQSRYSDAHTKAQSAAKFARVVMLMGVMSQLDAGLEADYKNPAAGALVLMRRAGLRPGSTSNTGADKQAFGATTLEARHVTLNKNSVRFQFVGKDGVNIDITSKDPLLVRTIAHHMEGKSRRDRLFATNPGRAADYMHSKVGAYKLKDLRTAFGSGYAASLVAKMPVPADMKAYKKQRREVGVAVAAVLGNTPAIALNSYVNPASFARWDAALAELAA